MKIIQETFDEISLNFTKLFDQSSKDIYQASQLMIESIKNNGKIIFCGNGGSAADSQHLSAELVGRYLKNRKSLPSISLTTDTSIITAISNDFSFDQIFSRQIEALGNKNDILYAISTSGTSRNIIKAIESAKKLGMKTIGITGDEINPIFNTCDTVISVPATRSDRIQEMHIAVGHIICELIENELC